MLTHVASDKVGRYIYIIVRRILVKIAPNVVKTSELVQIKL